MDRFRTREQLIADATLTLKSSLTIASKYALLDNICWVWSEFDGKIEGCRWWSKEARLLRDSRRELTHEHAVPRRVIIHHLLGLENPEEAVVGEVLHRFCVAVVITKEQDKRLNDAGLRQRMPVGWDGADVWARYRTIAVEPLDCAPAPEE
jgi:hypothetical protein